MPTIEELWNERFAMDRTDYIGDGNGHMAAYERGRDDLARVILERLNMIACRSHVYDALSDVLKLERELRAKVKQ